MAFELSEFPHRDADSYGVLPCLRRPAISAETVAIGGVSARSTQLDATTRLVRFFASAACRVRVGDGAVVAVANGSDGQSEYFPAGEHVIGVLGATYIAVIAAA